MSAIPASSVNLKTMADGTLRISFDVEPSQAQDAFKLFAAPGTQVAIVALRDGSFIEQKTAEPPKEPIGDACRRAVMWCKDPQFWRWIESTTHHRIFWSVINEANARAFVCQICNVESRRELDTDNEANKAWHREIREPYRLWLSANEGQAAQKLMQEALPEAVKQLSQQIDNDMYEIANRNQDRAMR